MVMDLAHLGGGRRHGRKLRSGSVRNGGKHGAASNGNHYGVGPVVDGVEDDAIRESVDDEPVGCDPLALGREVGADVASEFGFGGRCHVLSIHDPDTASTTSTKYFRGSWLA